MECQDALILISGHVDQVNTPEEEAALQAHLAACPECSRLLEIYEKMDETLATEVPVPEGFTEAVMEKLPKRRKRFLWGIPLGAAAGLAAAGLVLVLGLNVINQRFGAPASKDAAEPVENGAELAAPVPAETNHEDAVLRSPTVTEPGAELLPEVELAIETDHTGYSAGLVGSLESSLVEAQGPAETDPEVRLPRRGVHKGEISDPTEEMDQFCMTLAQEREAVVLRFDGLNEDLPTLVSDLSPELGEALDRLEFTEPEAGKLVAETDYQTLMALQEWLGAVLIPAPEETEDYGAQSYGYLGQIIDLREPLYLGALPETWPEDFADRWLAVENWGLYFPSEDYEPEDDSPAYLVLIPPAPQQ